MPPLVITQCDFNQDPPMVIVVGPAGVGFEFPISDYEKYRAYIPALPDLVCPN